MAAGKPKETPLAPETSAAHDRAARVRRLQRLLDSNGESEAWLARMLRSSVPRVAVILAGQRIDPEETAAVEDLLALHGH